MSARAHVVVILSHRGEERDGRWCEEGEASSALLFAYFHTHAHTHTHSCRASLTTTTPPPAVPPSSLIVQTTTLMERGATPTKDVIAYSFILFALRPLCPLPHISPPSSALTRPPPLHCLSYLSLCVSRPLSRNGNGRGGGRVTTHTHTLSAGEPSCGCRDG